MAAAKGQELERPCRCVTATDDALDKLDRQLPHQSNFAVNSRNS